MFQIVEPMVRAVGKLSLSLKMDGEKMVVVVMPQGDVKEPALRQPLILTGSPAELDAGFTAAMGSFTAVHRSLDEQVAATAAILQAAEKSQAGKAQKASSKGTTAGTKKASPASADESAEDEDDGETEASDSHSDATAQTSDAVQPATATGGTDLLSLL
jgi:PRTRC genetic system protein E